MKVVILAILSMLVAALALAATTPGVASMKLVPSGSQTIAPSAAASTIASQVPATQPADPGATQIYCNGALDIHWGASCPTSTPSVQICVGANCDARGIDPASCTANGQTFVPVNLRLDFNNPNVHTWYPTSGTLLLQVSGADQQFVIFQQAPNVGTAVSCYLTPTAQG